MKNIFIAIALLFALNVSGQTEVEVTYVEGLAFKNLTTTQLNNITTKEVGDTYFDVTKGNPVYWTGSAWRDLTGGGLSPGDQTKLNFITVTQNVDLDDIESKANSALQSYTETDPTVTPSSIKTDLETLTGNNRLSASAIRDISANETDPVFSASEAASITATNKANWNSAFGWGDWGVGVDQSFIEGLGFTVGGTAGADWDTNLTNIPSDIADGDTDTQLTPTQVVAAVDSELGQVEWKTGGSGVTDGDKGDITVSNSGATFRIDADAVGSPEIVSNAVGRVELQNSAVTPEKLNSSNTEQTGLVPVISIDTSEFDYIDPSTFDTDDQTASEVATNTTNFDGQLSSSEDTVQKSLDVLDDLDATSIPYSYDAINTSVGAQLDALRTGGITANQAQSIANTGLKFFRTVTDGESTALGHVRIVTDASADYGKAVINKHTLATEITVTLDADVPDGSVISYYNQNADGAINFVADTGFTINGFSDRKAVNDTTAFSGFIRDGTNFISLGGNELVQVINHIFPQDNAASVADINSIGSFAPSSPGILTVDTTTVHDGTYSLAVNSDVSSPYADITISGVTAGVSTTVTWWGYEGDANAFSYGRVLSSDIQGDPGNATTTLEGASWIQYTLTFVPASTSFGFRIGNGGSTLNLTSYFDLISVSQTP